MLSRRTVLLLVPHLGGGGAERVTSHLAAELPRKRYCMHLCVVTRQHVTQPHAPASVALHELGARRVRTAWWRLLRLIWRVRPDVIVSNMFHLNFLLLLLKPLLPREAKCVIRQNAPVGPETGTNATIRALYRLLYPRADKIICQTEAMADEMEALLGSNNNLRVLPNPVESYRAARAESHSAANAPQLLAIGRLTRQKGFDLLLPAFAAVLRDFPSTRLTILGEGPDETALKEQARALGIANCITFAGYVDDPRKWLAQASLFALSSRWEGMPNAMLEAASAGLPIVATPAWNGAAALLGNAPGTWLAREISAGALTESLLESLKFIRPMQRFPHAWLEPFRMENAMAQYENLIDEVLAEAVR